MTSDEVLEKLLRSYRDYYNINTEDPLEPFAAEAVFSSHEEGYWLFKKAKTSEADSHEYVYFYTAGHITLEDVKKLESVSWEDGMSRVRPNSTHRNSDVALILIGEEIDDDAFEAVKKMSNYKSYKWRFNGWSDFRSGALDISRKRFTCNRKGDNMKKMLKALVNNL